MDVFTVVLGVLLTFTHHWLFMDSTTITTMEVFTVVLGVLLGRMCHRVLRIIAFMFVRLRST
ncbi:hypothetical protein QBC39DRAFT_374034 [Podospora conica]|nr:hypothetical protein QBC39DRAFT_374034 [Schizothecium conicum]